MKAEIDEAFVKAEQNGCVTVDVNSMINFAELGLSSFSLSQKEPKPKTKKQKKGEPLELDNYHVSEAVFVLLELISSSFLSPSSLPFSSRTSNTPSVRLFSKNQKKLIENKNKTKTKNKTKRNPWLCKPRAS